MKVDTLEESRISDIGHAFGYYDYGSEHGLIDAFPSRDAAAAFIRGYVRMALLGGLLHTTSENGEAYIAYKRPGEKPSLKAVLPLAKGLLGSMGFGDLMRFARIMAKGEPGLDKRFDKEKKPYLFVGMVCVRESYQGQGYMRKVLKLAYDEADRLGVPYANCLVIEDSDAGIQAAKAGGMLALAVGAAKGNAQADYRAVNLEGMEVKMVFEG